MSVFAIQQCNYCDSHTLAMGRALDGLRMRVVGMEIAVACGVLVERNTRLGAWRHTKKARPDGHTTREDSHPFISYILSTPSVVIAIADSW